MLVPSWKVTTTWERPNFEIERSDSSPGSPEMDLLDGKGDLLLDLLRPEGRRDGVDLHLHRGGVGEGVDVEVKQRQAAHGRQDQRSADDQETVTQREVDDPVQHFASSR